MKYILLITAALLFSACAHKHDHHGDHKHESAKGDDCGCGHDDKAKHDHGDGHAHDHGDGHPAAATPAAWALQGNAHLNAEISKEEFDAGFEKNKAKLAKVCTSAASEYCGKTTKDLAITNEEAACLWGKTHRVTREVLAQLDKTPCEKALNKIKASKKVAAH